MTRRKVRETTLVRPRRARTPKATPNTAVEPIVAPGPPSAPAEPTGDASEFYIREWRGESLYECPGRDFLGRSHRSIIKHIRAVHTDDRPVEKRAHDAGIILARR